jgi:hypothetical protein
MLQAGREVPGARPLLTGADTGRPPAARHNREWRRQKSQGRPLTLAAGRQADSRVGRQRARGLGREQGVATTRASLFARIHGGGSGPGRLRGLPLGKRATEGGDSVRQEARAPCSPAGGEGPTRAAANRACGVVLTQSSKFNRLNPSFSEGGAQPAGGGGGAKRETGTLFSQAAGAGGPRRGGLLSEACAVAFRRGRASQRPPRKRPSTPGTARLDGPRAQMYICARQIES